MNIKLYTKDGDIISCNACGAYTLTGDENKIQHYPNCGGLAEVEKWNAYYSNPEWEKAVTGEE